MLIVAILLGFAIGYWWRSAGSNNPLQPPQFQSFAKPAAATAAVVSNGEPCARIGRDILEVRNGSVADAAIATMLCESIACPQSLGLGGGFMATIYIRETGESLTLNAREVAPLAATVDMFAKREAVLGAEAIAMPGALAGYWELHQRFGRLPWPVLFEEAIGMCERGVAVSMYLSGILHHYEPAIQASPSLASIFLDPATGRVLSAGQQMRMPRLAETLRTLAREGAAGFYQPSGTVYRQLRADLDATNASLLGERDFTGYKVRWGAPARASLLRGERTVLTSGLPATGFLATFVVSVLDGMEGFEREAVQSYHWLVEAYKWAFAKRTELADPLFVPEAQEVSENRRVEM